MGPLPHRPRPALGHTSGPVSHSARARTIDRGGVAERVFPNSRSQTRSVILWQDRDRRRPPGEAPVPGTATARGRDLHGRQRDGRPSQAGGSSVCVSQAGGGAPPPPDATMPPTMAHVVSTSPPAWAVTQNASS